LSGLIRTKTIQPEKKKINGKKRLRFKVCGLSAQHIGHFSQQSHPAVLDGFPALFAGKQKHAF
jgi:hypothetical protein